MITNESIFAVLRNSKDWSCGLIKHYGSHYRDFSGIIFNVRTRLEELKSNSLCGLNDNCLSIVPISEVTKSLTEKEDLSYFVWLRDGDNPPIVVSCSKNQPFTIFHIGKGVDKEDLNMQKYRPGTVLNISQFDLVGSKTSYPILPGYVIRIDCRPKDTGGPGHYFFYKLPRDLRVCGYVFEE